MSLCSRKVSSSLFLSCFLRSITLCLSVEKVVRQRSTVAWQHPNLSCWTTLPIAAAAAYFGRCMLFVRILLLAWRPHTLCSKGQCTCGSRSSVWTMNYLLHTVGTEISKLCSVFHRIFVPTVTWNNEILMRCSLQIFIPLRKPLHQFVANTWYFAYVCRTKLLKGLDIHLFEIRIHLIDSFRLHVVA